MNDKTKVKYNLARMYEYVVDILEICDKNHNDYNSIYADKTNKHAINMCIVQIGEHAARIRDADKTLYYDETLALSQVKGMRDRIVHSYGDIDTDIVKDVMKKDIPELHRYILENVHHDIIKNPYELYETEYDDYIEKETANNLPEFVREPLPEEEATRRLEASIDKHIETELQK